MTTARLLACCLALLAALHPAAAQEGFMGGFFVPAPMVETTAPEARAVVPDDALYNVVDMQGGVLAGPARLLWRPEADAYAYAVFPGENPDDTLYRPGVLTPDVLLWQSARPFDPDGLRLHEIFATVQADGMIVPLTFAVGALRPILARHGVALVPAPVSPGLANESGLWVLDGGPDAIRAALVEAVGTDDVVGVQHALQPVP